MNAPAFSDTGAVVTAAVAGFHRAAAWSRIIGAVAEQRDALDCRIWREDSDDTHLAAECRTWCELSQALADFLRARRSAT